MVAFNTAHDIPKNVITGFCEQTQAYQCTPLSDL